MPKMSPSDLRALLVAENADALSAMSASKLSDERSRALDYYLGDMSRDMPAPDGRSKAVSTDVADTIEGLMPTLMDIFASGDEVVRFEPVGPEDVAAAEQETDYVNHVFMQQNPGFMVLYSFIKDALLSKVGIVKVWWETREVCECETYLDQGADAFALIVGDPTVEVIAHTDIAQPARTGVLLKSCTTSPCRPGGPRHSPAWRACRQRNSASPATLETSARRATSSTRCSSGRKN
jgi:hypothetical protein